MPVDLLRIVDWWVGIPLCLICTGAHHLRRFWHGLTPESKEVRKVLVIKLSELGALILAYPFFKKMKQDYPQADMYVLTFQRNKQVFNFLDGIITQENIWTVDDSSGWAMATSLLGLAGKISREGFDIVIDLEFFTRISALLSFVSGARLAVGFFPYGLEGLYRGNFLTHRIFYNPLMHVSVNYYALAVALKEESKNSPEMKEFINEQEFTFPMYRSDSEAVKGLERLGIPSAPKYYLMNAGEGVLPLREWPLENFLKVAQSILENPAHVLILVGTETGKEKAQQLLLALHNPRVIDLSGKTSLNDLMELFLMAEAVIANDCGLIHLAMLTPVKKIVLFGPESPKVFGPLTANTHVLYSHWPCSPCLSVLNHRNSSCRDNQCLKAVTVQEVLDAF